MSSRATRGDSEMTQFSDRVLFAGKNAVTAALCQGQIVYFDQLASFCRSFCLKDLFERKVAKKPRTRVFKRHSPASEGDSFELNFFFWYSVFRQQTENIMADKKVKKSVEKTFVPTGKTGGKSFFNPLNDRAFRKLA